MAAALVQPALRTMNTHFDLQMDTSTDAANHANEINILPEEEAKSDTDLPALAGEIESESDEEIQAKLKRSKGKKPKKKVLSDDSGDDSMEDQSHQNEGTGNGGKDREFGNESDEEDIIQGSMVDDDSDNEGNSFTKVHKKRARVLEDDSDDQDHGDREEVKTAKDTAKKFSKKENKGKYNDGTRKSRRKEKEEIGKRSDKGNAVKQLLNSRKKKRLKTFKEEGTATSSDSEEEVSKTKSRKKRKLKAKSQDEDVSLKAGDSSRSELDSDQELIQNKHDKIDNVKKTKKPVNDDKEKSDIENAEENHNSEKEESELSSCGSSIEDDIEQTNFKKSYGTRRKTAAKKAIDSEDKIDKAQQLKTNKILENTDLFEAESGESDDDNLKQNSDAEKDLTSGNKKNSTKKKKAKENRPRKPKKSELFESQSNQQKLLREQSVSIPEHRPAEVSIHQFLQRVPSLSSKRKSVSKRDDAKETVPVVSKVEPADQNKKSYTNSQDNVNKLSLAPLPMLSAAVDDVVLEFEADVEDKKENAGMSLLMKRLAKHTALPKHKQLQKKAQAEEIEIMESELEATQASKKTSIIDVEKIKMAAEIPGSGLLELKSQLQKRMKVVREVHRKEAEVRHKLENEDFDDQEEEWEEQSDVEEDSSDNDDVIGDKNKRRSGKNVKKNRESEDEDDDEIRKWNEEDERKQIENQIDEMEEFEKKLESSSLNRSNILRVNASHDENTTASARTASSSLDLFPGVNDEDESRADHSFNLELKDTIQWDETSTIPPGQGEFSKPSDKSRLEASTPFSKLLYGTRRYSSTSDEHSRTIHDDEFATKDSQFKMDTDESSRVGPILSDDLHFTLDENTQFSQILDTQGYINPRKPSKEKLAPKKLLRSEDPSMTQLLGLCYGNFEKDKSKSINMNVDDFGLPSDLPCDDSKTDGNSQEILDLCTGNFGTPAARIESPAKKGSVLEKLLNESDAVTSDTQIMELCSGTFSSAVESQVYGEPLIEESKSAGSLMKHFGEPKMDSYARKSFDNLFNADKRSTGTNEKELGSLDHGGLIMNDNESDVDPELLELCTGNFAQTGQEKNETTKSPMFYIGKKMKQSIVDYENGPEYDTNQKTGEDEDEGEEVSEGTNDTDDEDLHEGADGDASKNGAEPAVEDDCSLASSNARRGSDGEEEEEEMDEELQEYYETLPSKKFSKKRFYEEEAELSGSDVGEDDEDLGSEADEYEIDSDIEDLPSDARIQAQVHKAHMKATLEDDRQDIRRIQERFYEDGDLLSDGVGRRRNFRWRNIDRPLNDTVESVGSDNEDVDENENEPESHKEAEKRIARLEREAFLEEQRKAQETIILDEDSQCILNIIKDSRTTQETNGPAKPMSQKNSCSFKRQGSFLDRSKTTLSRLSSLTSTRSKPNVPTRSFVYQSKSSNDTPDGPDASKKIRRPLPNTEPPRPKKARIDRTLSQPTGSSIFSHL